VSPLPLLALALVSAAAPDGGSLKAVALVRPVEVTSDKLEILGKDNRAIYSGNAKAVRDATTITCDRLVVHYSNRQEVQRIDAVGRVVAVENDKRATGDQAEFDNTTGVLTMTGAPAEAFQGGNHVAGPRVVFTSGTDLIEVDDAKTVVEENSATGAKAPVLIDAKHLKILGHENQAVWTGNVKAKRGTTNLKGAKLTAFYGQDKELLKLEVRGGAEVLDQDRWARGERADFDPKTGVLVVTGNPEARQGKNRMRGTKVTFTQGSDKLEVENPRTVIRQEQKK
jgi:lipopolysaccharide export system protein LptA